MGKTIEAKKTCFVYYCCCSVRSVKMSGLPVFGLIRIFSLEAAASNPETLSQEAIIDNLDPVEAERLSKIRNIGIAVGLFFLGIYNVVAILGSYLTEYRE